MKEKMARKAPKTAPKTTNIYSYSFYIPERDEQLREFIESQSNLSMSMRLLMKAFIAHYESDFPDITAMDLNELIKSARLDVPKTNRTSKTEPSKRPNYKK